MIRLAMLGCGAIARAHARRLRRYRDVHLGFASRDPAAAEHRYAHSRSPILSALAAIVRLGFTPADIGKALPSET